MDEQNASPSAVGLESAALDLYEALVLMVDMFETTDMRYTGRTPEEAQRRIACANHALDKARAEVKLSPKKS